MIFLRARSIAAELAFFAAGVSVVALICTCVGFCIQRKTRRMNGYNQQRTVNTNTTGQTNPNPNPNLNPKPKPNPNPNPNTTDQTVNGDGVLDCCIRLEEYCLTLAQTLLLTCLPYGDCP